MVKICGICRLLALNGWEKIDWRFSVTVCFDTFGTGSGGVRGVSTFNKSLAGKSIGYGRHTAGFARVLDQASAGSFVFEGLFSNHASSFLILRSLSLSKLAHSLFCLRSPLPSPTTHHAYHIAALSFCVILQTCARHLISACIAFLGGIFGWHETQKGRRRWVGILDGRVLLQAGCRGEMDH